LEQFSEFLLQITNGAKARQARVTSFGSIYASAFVWTSFGNYLATILWASIRSAAFD
jgi:hypothetical protein